MFTQQKSASQQTFSKLTFLLQNTAQSWHLSQNKTVQDEISRQSILNKLYTHRRLEKPIQTQKNISLVKMKFIATKQRPEKL
jgi:hypothetical protein